MKKPHHRTVDKQWNIAKRALMISYIRARDGQACVQDVDFEEAMEAVKKLFEWGKTIQDEEKK